MSNYDPGELVRDRVDGVDILMGPGSSWPAPGDGEPAMTVGAAACVVSRFSGTGEIRTGPATVATELAGDLAWRPQAFVALQSGDYRGPLTWLVTVLAFIEEEAAQACEQIGAALLDAVRERALTRAR